MAVCQLRHENHTSRLAFSPRSTFWNPWTLICRPEFNYLLLLSCPYFAGKLLFQLHLVCQPIMCQNFPLEAGVWGRSVMRTWRPPQPRGDLFRTQKSDRQWKKSEIWSKSKYCLCQPAPFTPLRGHYFFSAACHHHRNCARLATNMVAHLVSSNREISRKIYSNNLWRRFLEWLLDKGEFSDPKNWKRATEQPVTTARSDVRLY